MLERIERRRGLLFGAIALIGFGVATASYATGFVGGLEFDSMDARFEIRGERDPPDDIVVVGIDTETFDRIDTFPFPRRFHARAIDAIREDGAKRIAYDVQFTEPTNVRDDNALINAVARSPGTVLATSEVSDEGGTRVLGGDQVLADVGARAGHTDFEPDQGVYRRVPFELDGLESFAVATVESETGEEVDRDEFPEGSAWIDYYGGVDTFPHVSFGDVVAGEFEPGTFEDKLVVVGATASTLQDVHATPFSDTDLTPGPEIQANAIATVRDGIPLRSAPVTVDLLLIALLSLVPAAINLRLTPVRAFLAEFALAGVYLVAVQIAFNSGTILPVVYPLLGLGVTAIGSLGVQYLREAFERQRARDTFARFVPEPVVGEALERAGGLRLGGRRYDVTVLFSDIRGFTTFSESRSPEDVIEILNRYLGEMTEAILDNGGTLVSYMGDGIMAVFGAPIAQDDHADRSLVAAREMLGERLEAFNRWIVDEGLSEPFRMGVGLNSGPVMAGMVGSERRLDYTAIGDTVNTSARLEGMTKGTDHQLFIADSTRSRLGSGADELEFVDEMPVRGRAHGIKVWAVRGL